MADRMWDPDSLTRAQRAGRSCVVCGKQWPAPRVVVGHVPDGDPVMACAGCAAALPADEAGDL